MYPVFSDVSASSEQGHDPGARCRALRPHSGPRQQQKPTCQRLRKLAGKPPLIADLRVRVVGSLEEVAPVLAKRQQGAASQFLSSVCVRGDLAASPKARARRMPPPDPKRGPSLQLSLGTLFCCAPSSPFQGRTRGGAPPPRPVGDKVSESPGSGRMQRAHASLQASVISPARHGRFCSSAAPKPRNLVRTLAFHTVRIVPGDS